MATSSKNIDLNSVFEQAAAQFRGLNTSEPGQWPTLPKVAVWLLVTVTVVVVFWFGLLSATADQLESERGREPTRGAHQMRGDVAAASHAFETAAACSTDLLLRGRAYHGRALAAWLQGD